LKIVWSLVVRHVCSRNVAYVGMHALVTLRRNKRNVVTSTTKDQPS